MSVHAEMRRSIVAALGALACVGTACDRTPKPPPADLTGWYVRNVGDGREVIDVRPDGDYVHVVTIKGAPARTDEAHWHSAGDSVITLTFFRDAPDVATSAPRRDSVRAAIRPAPQNELQLVLPGDSATFLRRLRYGRQHGG